jgi:hypothetical protein
LDRLIFLVEELSMQAFLDIFLRRLYPELPFLCVPHNGKAHLERNIVHTLREWRVPGDRFVILRDNDGGDCYELKERLRGLCRRGGREDTLIRIVCQELEGWYLGEPDALADAFGDERLRNIGRQATYRNPDSHPKPSSDLAKLNPSFEKSSGARRMAERMTRERNRSHSFAVFLSGVERLLADNA